MEPTMVDAKNAMGWQTAQKPAREHDGSYTPGNFSGVDDAAMFLHNDLKSQDDRLQVTTPENGVFDGQQQDHSQDVVQFLKDPSVGTLRFNEEVPYGHSGTQDWTQAVVFDGESVYHRKDSQNSANLDIGRFRDLKYLDAHHSSSVTRDDDHGGQAMTIPDVHQGDHTCTDVSQDKNDHGNLPNNEYHEVSVKDVHREEVKSSSNSAGESRTGARRRSRWEPTTDREGETQDSAETASRRRKSRWAAEPPKSVFSLPDFAKDLTGGIEIDPEIQALNIMLLEINTRLQTGQVLDERSDRSRSPSPEPIYDNMGIRVNTREYRARESLLQQRQEVISELLKRNPAFKPPADYRPPKLHKKLFIPVKQYPGYNFIGLVIGPRGNTQKRMQRETGAKIVIRGKGSIKEGRLNQKRDMKPDPGENEDLHVYIEADNQQSLDSAVSMVEKLLVPVGEEINEHKRAQLRELAALNGTISENEFCRICGEPGHRQFLCPTRNSTFKSEVQCRHCGDGGHPSIDCPMKDSGSNKMDDEYASFVAELGVQNSDSPGISRPMTHGVSLVAAQSQGPFPQFRATTKLPKEADDSNLYVGYLPPSIDDEGLSKLFSPFGTIEDIKLIKDHATGWSKGYGFVKFADPSAASQAVAQMNGYQLDGRFLVVRIAGKPPTRAGLVAPPSGPPVPPPPPLPQQQPRLSTPPAPPMLGGPPPQGLPAPQGPPPPQGPSAPQGAPPPWGAPPLMPPYNPYGPVPRPYTGLQMMGPVRGPYPFPPGSVQTFPGSHPGGLQFPSHAIEDPSASWGGASNIPDPGPHVSHAPGVAFSGPPLSLGCLAPPVMHDSTGQTQLAPPIPPYAGFYGPVRPAGYYGPPHPAGIAAPVCTQAANGAAVPASGADMQPADDVESEYEKFISEMGR